MLTLQRRPAPRTAARTRKATKREQAVTAERVRELLLQLAFALHATRVVGRVDEGVAKKW